MKTMMRLLGKLNKRVVGIMLCAALISVCMITYVRAEGVSGYNGQALYNSSLVTGSYVYNNIEKIYGADAKNAYVNGVITGDYTQFRTAIGDWRPVCDLPNINIKADGSNYVGEICTTEQAYEYTTYELFGKYGTVSDLFAYAAQYGYNLSDQTQFNNFKLDVILWKTVPYPAKKKAPSTAAQPAAKAASAASNSKVEALKSYKGNTAEFNAYYYYVNYPDLQTAIGADGKALLKHYNEFGKAEGRVASKSIK